MARSTSRPATCLVLLLVACTQTGPVGPAGPTGDPGASVTVTSVPEGDPACPVGGARISGPGGDAWACNGAPGADATFDPSQFVQAGTAPQAASFHVTGDGTVGGALGAGSAVVQGDAQVDGHLAAGEITTTAIDAGSVLAGGVSSTAIDAGTVQAGAVAATTVAAGTLRLGTVTVCDAAAAGTLGWDGASRQMQLCDGARWSPLATVSMGDGLTPASAAASCRALLAAAPGAADGTYWIDVDGPAAAAPFQAYCDMTTAGGGWTRVNGLGEAAVNALRGPAWQQLLKCSDAGASHLVSPLVATGWSWSSRSKVWGSWTANGAALACGVDAEFDLGAACGWGIGCSDGPGDVPKLYGGAVGTSGCGLPAQAHTGGAMSICGEADFAAYAIFVR